MEVGARVRLIARGGRLDGTVVKMGTDGRCRVQLDASGRSTWAPFKDLELVEKGRPPLGLWKN